MSKRAFRKRIKAAVERTKKLPHVAVGCQYVPFPYEITPEMIRKLSAK